MIVCSRKNSGSPDSKNLKFATERNGVDLSMETSGNKDENIKSEDNSESQTSFVDLLV